MICTRKDFINIAGIKSPSNLTTYIDRGKVVMDSNGMFDTDNIINKDFLAKRSSQGLGTAVSESLTKTKPEPIIQQSKQSNSYKSKAQTNQDKERDQQQKKKYQIETEKAQAELEYKLIQTELGKQKLNVLMGNNLPVEFVKELVAQLSQSYIKNYSMFAENHVTEICHKYRIPSKDRVRLVSENVNAINKIHEKAIDEARRKLKSIIGESKVKAVENDTEDED